MELKKYKFNDIVIGDEGLLKGPFGSDLKKELYVPKSDSTYKVYLQENILKQNNTVGKHYISQEYYNKAMSRYAVKEGDFIVTCDGTLGEIFQLKNIKEKGIISSSLLRITLNNEICDEVFFPYFWKAKMKNSLITKANNSVLKHLPGLTDIRKFTLELPTLDYQRKIASVLSSLDSKIALNRRINTKLETIAKRLYDYWFVQFDFPDENGKPYKSSGGKMVWNDALKREIPEGWEVKSVAEITTAARGVSYTAKDEKTADEDNVVLILRGNNIVDNHIVYDSNAVYVDSSFVLDEQIIKKYDVVITMSSGSKEHVGKSAMFFTDSPHSYGAFCNKLTPKRNCQFFLENYLHSDFFIKYIRQSCSGTGINNLTNAHFKKSIFAFPPTAILSDFNQKVNSIYEKRGIVEQEITRLTALRDKLLPLLMNGQVEVA